MDSYNKSIEGSSHKISGLPCQDYSVSENFEHGSIIAISDGHGSETYVRSDVGSKLACQIAVEETKQFISNNYEILSRNQLISNGPDSGREPETMFTELFSAIHDKWYKAILEDSSSNTFSALEKRKLGKANIKHAYGCTLIVAVKTDDFMFAYQIGDGRLFTISFCDEWKQPVPWDKDCEDNITTSLCEQNPVERFRYYLNSTKNQPYAVFICSDGIEDCYAAYHDGNFKSEGLVVDYEEVIRCYLQDNDFEKSSTDFLMYQSEKFSHDDMSIAFILDNKHELQDKWLELAKIRRKVFDIRSKYNIIKNRIAIINGRIGNIEANIKNSKKELQRIKNLIDLKNTTLKDSKQKKEDEEKCVEIGTKFNYKINNLYYYVNDYNIDIECNDSLNDCTSKEYRSELKNLYKEIIKKIEGVLDLTRKDIKDLNINVSKFNLTINDLNDDIIKLNEQKKTLEDDQNIELDKLRTLRLEKKDLEESLTNHKEDNEEEVRRCKERVNEIKDSILKYFPVNNENEETDENVSNSYNVLNISKKSTKTKDEDVNIVYENGHTLFTYNTFDNKCSKDVSSSDYENLINKLKLIDDEKYLDKRTDNCIIIMEPDNESSKSKYIPLEQTEAKEIWDYCMTLINISND